MVALLRQLARRIDSSVLQRAKAAVTSQAVAEERRRLVPRRTYSTEMGAGDDGMAKWRERALRIRRIDSQFTTVLNSCAGAYCVYAILASGESPPWPIRKYRLKVEEEGA